MTYFLWSSPVTNLVFVQQIYEFLKEYNQVDIIYTHLTKPFDCVNHEILIKKFINIDLPYKLLLLRISYLFDREYIVQYGGYSSCLFTPCSGVSQDLNFGPLFFIVFINYLLMLLYCFWHVNNLFHLLYADDLKLYLTILNMLSRLNWLKN